MNSFICVILVSALVGTQSSKIIYPWVGKLLVEFTASEPSCPQNEILSICGKRCEDTCKNVLLKTRPCLLICDPPACVCKYGYARHSNGTCLAIWNCPIEGKSCVREAWSVMGAPQFGALTELMSIWNKQYFAHKNCIYRVWMWRKRRSFNLWQPVREQMRTVTIWTVPKAMPFTSLCLQGWLRSSRWCTLRTDCQLLTNYKPAKIYIWETIWVKFL